MWRLILPSFAFMGVAFYQLSGGADYAPRPDSLQVVMAERGIFATPAPYVPTPVRVAEAADNGGAALPPPVEPQADRLAAAETAPSAEDQAVSRALAALDSLPVTSMDTETARVTLASAPDRFGIDPVLGLSAMTGAITAVDPDMADLQVDTGAAPLLRDVPSTPADIRRVSGSLVNMREGPGRDYAQVDQLSGGTRVEVLESAGNGWLRLRTLDSGREGWMAGSLVTASN